MKWESRTLPDDCDSHPKERLSPDDSPSYRLAQERPRPEHPLIEAVGNDQFRA